MACTGFLSLSSEVLPSLFSVSNTTITTTKATNSSSEMIARKNSSLEYRCNFTLVMKDCRVTNSSAVLPLQSLTTVIVLAVWGCMHFMLAIFCRETQIFVFFYGVLVLHRHDQGTSRSLIDILQCKKFFQPRWKMHASRSWKHRLAHRTHGTRTKRYNLRCQFNTYNWFSKNMSSPVPF